MIPSTGISFGRTKSPKPRRKAPEIIYGIQSAKIKRAKLCEKCWLTGWKFVGYFPAKTSSRIPKRKSRLRKSELQKYRPEKCNIIVDSSISKIERIEKIIKSRVTEVCIDPAENPHSAGLFASANPEKFSWVWPEIRKIKSRMEIVSAKNSK